MQQPTADYLTGLFRSYYSEHPPSPPPESHRREWGFIHFSSNGKPVMHRHRGFSSDGEVGEYLKGIGPAHCYHSAAYYGSPNATTMDGKGWQGADLIFDLDADHLPNPSREWSESLQAVKVESKRLLEFLLCDLGIDENEIRLVFSGGRGYHLHVRNEQVLALGSAERRELVDYIAGRLQPDHFLKRYMKQSKYQRDGGIYTDGWDADSKGRSNGGGKKSGFKNASTMAPGWIIMGVMGSGTVNWPARISRYIVNRLQKWGRLTDEELKNELKKYISSGVKQSINDIRRVAQDPEKLDQILQYGKIELGKNFDRLLREMIKQSVEEFRVEAGGKPDEPVTADLHRLIRLPGSVHGGSSLLCLPLAMDDLDDFKPLRDAIAFSDEPVPVTVINETAVELGKKRYRVSPGAGDVPQHLAAYLMCRGFAEYGP